MRLAMLLLNDTVMGRDAKKLRLKCDRRDHPRFRYSLVSDMKLLIYTCRNSTELRAKPALEIKLEGISSTLLIQRSALSM
jgi:hypothetical protein